jgi:hypothetical protein
MLSLISPIALYVECRVFSILLSAVMLDDVKLNVVMLSVVSPIFLGR